VNVNTTEPSLNPPPHTHKDLLAPGGVWINLGPLLWHFHDVPGEVSIELSWEELRALIVSYGFVIEAEEWKRCSYTTNPKSLYQTEYNCIFFTARKPAGRGGVGVEF